MKWITRERPKIDRIACPWLIERFIDKAPEFLYVPSADVLRVAEETGAIPYDIPGVELTHERSEEHTSELQSLMRISYAVFCLKKKTQQFSRQPMHVN